MTALDDETVIVWRTAWQEGHLRPYADHDTRDAAERHAQWLKRRSGRTTDVALVYPVRIWLEETA